jgi:hypothetical protein
MTERKEATWEEVERPIGPQPIPLWCKAVHIDWMMGYGNAPNVLVKTKGEDWPDKRFRKEGECYIAEHPDGRGEMHVHDGKVGLYPVKAFRRPDGSLHQNRRYGPEWPEANPMFKTADGIVRGHEPGEWVETPMRATTQQDGYAGRHFWITLDDGEPLVLRGPWHCGAPKGYLSITTVDMDYAEKHGIGGRRSPWWKNLGCFGTALRVDVYIAVLSRFVPHLPLALVTYNWGGPYLEVYKSEWGEPKDFWLKRQHAARAA